MIFNPKSTHPWWYHYLYFWIEFAEGLVGILCFGFVYLNWTLPYSRWYMKRCIQELKRSRS